MEKEKLADSMLAIATSSNMIMSGKSGEMVMNYFDSASKIGK